MYLTYSEYIEYGGTLEETAFEQLEFEARTRIDWWTFNRLQNETEYPEAVKRCMFKIISLLDAQTNRMLGSPTNSEISAVRGGIASESNDGVATTYNILSAKEAVDTLQKNIRSTIRMYLGSVRNSLGQKVLYRGLYPNE